MVKGAPVYIYPWTWFKHRSFNIVYIILGIMIMFTAIQRLERGAFWVILIFGIFMIFLGLVNLLRKKA